jgi:feruloyl-CoA synthase
MPVSIDRPLTILGGNGINHALLMLAAMSVGIPVAIVSPAYAAARAEPWVKFASVVRQIGPGLIVADDVAVTMHALAATERSDVLVQSLVSLDWIDATPVVSAAKVDAAEASVGPDSIAKLLLTSGSTGAPKAVVNTQAMMVSNMQGLALVWPFLLDRPPVLLDWLPWNHTFGGNCCFNIVLFFRGTKMLLPLLEADSECARAFLERLDFLFSAGAPLPGALRTRIEALTQRVLGRTVPIFGGWGSTETAPFSTVLYFPTTQASNLGAPLPGTAIKLMPEGGRLELRLRGPNVMPGYWRDDAATAAAFDEDGFCRIGDAGKLADPDDPNAGILFDGRISENFKLSSGTWVNVGALRMAAISACDTLISDAVVVGEGRDDVGLLVFVNELRCRQHLVERHDPAFDGVAGTHDVIRARIGELLRQHNSNQIGSSTRIARFLVLAEPPSPNDGEITGKGYLDQRVLIERRGDAIARLFGSEGRF